MAFHSRCPHEISSHIVSYLWQDELTIACRVSPLLKAIAQPLLYREPCIITGTQTPLSLYIFLRTLLTPGRETLATHVHWLTVHWTNQQPDLLRQPPTDTALLTTFASSLGLPTQFSHCSALVVLLLHLLPRLHTLHVIPAHDRDGLDGFFSAVPATLHSLREFRWYSAQSHSGVSPTVLRALLRLPRLRIIDVHMVTELPPTALEGQTSDVTHLEFSFGGLSAPSLGRVLAIPRALTHLTYRAVAGNRGSMAELAAALRPVRETLRHLDLDVFRCVGRKASGVCGNDSIGSLREWPALRSVRCSLAVLVGIEGKLVDVLPLRLEALETVEDPLWTVAEVVGEVLEVVRSKQRAVPRLRTVAVHVGRGKSGEVMRPLRDACVAGGVRLVEGCEKPFV